ncbi:MAG: hypothetical protein DU480_08590 [Nitrosomonas sp.]|uniref:hypothetical protein n=1 Tax=Nitrosomonas sp. TaxID=42353 RepID=UPI0032ECCB03
MNIVHSILVVGVVIVIGALIYILIECMVSLDHSRSQNEVLQAKCELLARLADDGLRDHFTDSVIKLAGVNVIVKIEGPEFRLNDVILHAQSGKITGVDIAETCR